MKVTIEHSFCQYCDEATELYFRIINTILFSIDEADLRGSMERLKSETALDDYLFSVMGHIICGSVKDASVTRPEFSRTG